MLTDEISQVADALEQMSRRLRLRPLSTNDYWSEMAKVAIERLDLTRKRTNAQPKSTSV